FNDYLLNGSINSVGQVVFSAGLDSGEAGIFTGPDPVADKVVGTGDALFGSTVAAVAISEAAINDGGQVAFWTLLTDERQVVGRADPQLALRNVRRAPSIAVAPDLGGSGHMAVNFTGSAGAGGDTWISVYDTTPGDARPTVLSGSVSLS